MAIAPSHDFDIDIDPSLSNIPQTQTIGKPRRPPAQPIAAGTKRKRIDFVPSNYGEEVPKPSQKEDGRGSTRVADLYLNVVLPGQQRSKQKEEGERRRRSENDGGEREDRRQAEDSGARVASTDWAPTTAAEALICTICHTSMNDTSCPHESTFPHQFSLPHSTPPSALDRRNRGFLYLAAYGWDPDARKGLGAQGREGRLDPVKTRLKEGRQGVGVDVMPVGDKGEGSDGDRRYGRREREKNEKMRETEGMGKGEKRRRESERKRKGERYRELMYGREEVNRFLGVEL
ncbi:MAG: hypothetical protein M1831_001670 [Alyxoria varia]|nr:MAG: hypothetical protein M1831_001670 [Alyxoria varia]